MKSNLLIWILIIPVISLFSCQSKELKRAEALVELKEYNDAIPLLEIELASKPKSAKAYFLMGICDFRTTGYRGKFDEYFEKAILLKKRYSEKIGQYIFNSYFDQFEENVMNSGELGTYATLRVIST